MLGHLLIALLGLFSLLGLWLAIQAWARRSLPADAEERDVLACALCRRSGVCHCGLGGARGEGGDPR